MVAILLLEVIAVRVEPSTREEIVAICYAKITEAANFQSPEFPIRSSQIIRHSRSDSPRLGHLKRCRTSKAGFGVSSHGPICETGTTSASASKRRDISETFLDLLGFGGSPASHVAAVLLEVPTRRVKLSFTSRQNCADCLRPSSMQFALVMSIKLRRSSSTRPLRCVISFLVRSNCCAVVLFRWVRICHDRSEPRLPDSLPWSSGLP